MKRQCVVLTGINTCYGYGFALTAHHNFSVKIPSTGRGITNMKDVCKSPVETYYFMSYTQTHTHTHPYTHMHTKQFNWSYPTQRINLPPEALGCQIKSPKHDISSLVVGQGCSRDFSKQYKILPVLLVAYQNLILKPYCWRHHILWSHGMEKSNWYWLGSFLPIGQLSEY